MELFLLQRVPGRLSVLNHHDVKTGMLQRKAQDGREGRIIFRHQQPHALTSKRSPIPLIHLIQA